MVFCKADEPAFCSDGDYSWGLSRFLTSTRTAWIGFWHGRPCSRTTRVTAFRMGGSEFARGRENSCCVRLQRVAGACFATFIEQHFPSQVPEHHGFLMDSPSRSRIRRNMQHLGPSRAGLCLCAYCAAAHMRRCACCAYAQAAQQRTCAHAHYAHPRIVCAEYASAHNTRRRRIIRAHAHSLRICATAHHLRSCTCAHTLRAHLLRTCAAPFVHAALGHAAFVHARIVIQGAAEAAAGRGSPPPPSWGSACGARWVRLARGVLG